jgi:hypothetical protein
MNINMVPGTGTVKNQIKMVQKKTSKSGGTPQNEHQHGTRYRKKSNQNGTEKTSKSGGTLQNEYQHGTRYRKKLN